MTALISLASMPGSTASGNSTPVLQITQGLHQGVCLPLDRSVYIIGSGADADLLLSDAGIAERHLVLRFDNGQVAVEAVGGDVLAYGSHGRETLIPAGKGHRARLPLDIRIGEARLTLSLSGVTDTPHTASARRIPAGWQRKPQWVIALLLMFLCVGAFAFRSEPVSPLALAGADKEPLPTSQPRRSAATVGDARVWLDQQLAAAGLKQVKVSEVQGQLSVQGTYDPAQKSQWRSVQQAFDSRFGQQIVLHPNVIARAEIAKPRVRFQAVWFGANPYVINDSGKRLYPGAALADDWTLESIENNQVILARGEERFTFTL